MIKNNFAHNLRLLREYNNLSREEFGEPLKSTGDQVYTWEERNTRPKPITLERIADQYGISIELFDSEKLTLKKLIAVLEKVEKDKDSEKNNRAEKEVSFESHAAHSIIRIEAMLRVLLRSQAELLAAQRKQPLIKVLGELTRDVKSEISKGFGEL